MQAPAASGHAFKAAAKARWCAASRRPVGTAWGKAVKRGSRDAGVHCFGGERCTGQLRGRAGRCGRAGGLVAAGGDLLLSACCLLARCLRFREAALGGRLLQVLRGRGGGRRLLLLLLLLVVQL